MAGPRRLRLRGPGRPPGRPGRLNLGAALAVLVALAACCGACRRPAPPEPPSIILITLDTTRADHLGCYGYFRDTTPHLDAFARECVFFERCIVPVATTLPTHTSILTAVYPLEHGILANLQHGGARFTPSPLLQSFAETARAAGYRTAAFVSAVPLKRETGIDAGFETFDEPEGIERRAAGTNAAVLRYLDGLGHERPLFLWVHYFDPHVPYDPPAPYDAAFAADPALEAYLAERRFADEAVAPDGRGYRARASVNLYDGELRYMDAQFGALLERLRQRPDWERTIVIVAGDHGEGLCQHGQPTHGYIWHEQLHVPLMIRAPGWPPRRVAAPVSVIDIFPTVLARRDTAPLAAFLDQASGVDMLAPDYAATAVFSQNTARKRPDQPARTYTLTTGRWKYVHEVDGREWLYDLAADPYELTDVSAGHPAVVADLKAELLRRVEAQHRRGAEFAAARSAATAPVDPEYLRQLKALGYAP